MPDKNRETSRSHPIRHLSIRVPWHDNGWDGTVCQKPRMNSACLKLPRIAANRIDGKETEVAGKLLHEIDQSLWPCCIAERSTFMAGFEYTRLVEHPYRFTSPETHGHFAPTPLRHPQFSAATIPFRWMFKETLEKLGKEYDLDVDPNREPDLGFHSAWVQEGSNQRTLLDCFFDHVRPGKSLCFFYAKQVPFVEDSRRVLIGVGWVRHISDTLEYQYQREGRLRSVLWERMIQHSIRPTFDDGFILPYHAAVKYAQENSKFDPAEIVAFAPEDRWGEFSFATEHVTHDGALASLLSCAQALHTAGKYLAGPWDRCLRWIDDRLGELWKMRGPCPGLGSALSAFGLEFGSFVAREIEGRLQDNDDPWPSVDQMFRTPSTFLSADLAKSIGKTLQMTWWTLPAERRALLKLLSRFEITPDQAKLLYVQEVRQQSQIQCTDREILENPYLLYELTRLTAAPASVWTIDRGAFPERVVRAKHPLPAPSELDSGTDARRIRALAVSILETASTNGSTLLSRKDTILSIRGLNLQPSCEVTVDLMGVAEESFGGIIEKTALNDATQAYQLSRLAQIGDVIRNAVGRRRKGMRLEVHEDWRKLLDGHLGPISPNDDAEQEQRARIEKAAALKELAETRFSILIGPAGTGKTTLLSVLCSQEDIAAGEILLLAPTGKARVRMEQASRLSGHNLKGFTIAQFLGNSGRYDYETGRYRLSDTMVVSLAQTVIVDEASMLTEEMLGALLQAVRNARRIILVGDPRQLPPIGSGRPFVDIVSELAPENVHGLFPRVGKGYAELTVRRRQAGKAREDLQLAEWFSGTPISPGEDDIFENVVKAGSSGRIRFIKWDTSEALHQKLIEVLVEELKLGSPDDMEGFDRKLGAAVKGHYSYFNLGCARDSENWQILTPVRGYAHGVPSLNRLIHTQFRSKVVETASRKDRMIPKPMGSEQIVYGDKIINIANHRRTGVYPKENAANYIANGEIGIVVGQLKTKNMQGLPWLIKIEFSSQPGFQYDFRRSDFKEEAEPKLELAYALTVHKAQGSEFNLVILVLPNPCRLLSRELLYTALTRQRNRIVILHQGNRNELKRFASDEASETSVRLTNLFEAPRVVEAKGKFFEDRLINRTRRGELVRSKSEVIIADRLADLNVDYLYEKELTIAGITKYPDFTIEDMESGRTFYWEHCGMFHDPEYRLRWENKLQWYREHRIIPHEEGDGERGTLIITTDSKVGGISSQEIERIIKEVILS